MKHFLVVALMLVSVLVIFPGNAGAWFVGEAPSPEYGDDELKEAARIICLADLKWRIKYKSFAVVNMTRRACFVNLLQDIEDGKASLVVKADYHLGDFGELKRTGIMGWSFIAYCESKAITITSHGKFDFSKQSTIDCFIWIRDDGEQFFGLPGDLNSFANWEE